jgi:hypothetical protein
LYKVEDDWIWVGMVDWGKVAFMSNSRERIVNDIKELFNVASQGQPEATKQVQGP